MKNIRGASNNEAESLTAKESSNSEQSANQEPYSPRIVEQEKRDAIARRELEKQNPINAQKTEEQEKADLGKFYRDLNVKASRLSGRLMKLDILLKGERNKTVNATVYGPFAVHEDLVDQKKFAVTHIKTGLKISVLPTRQEAKELIVWSLDPQLKLNWNFDKRGSASEETKAMCRQIVKRFHAERALVFGSRSTGLSSAAD